MEIVYVGDRNPSNRALLISNEEWKRLGKMLTKKMDDEDAAEAVTRLKEMRREMSKKMVDGWGNTELNKTKKILEQKRKALLELEDQRRQRDEEMKREAQEAKNKVIEKARRLKFEERDSVKMFNRALQLSEMFKERAIQLKFNETERLKTMEKDLLTARQENNKAEQYKNDQIDEKRRSNELKRAKADNLLEELKDREEQRRNEKIALYEEGKAELRKIAEEIEEVQEKARAQAREAKEKLQKDIAENRRLIASNDETLRAEDEEEEIVTTIMANTKKTLARARRLKEMELMEIKQAALDEMKAKVAVKQAKEKEWAQSDVENAIEAQEQRYRDEQQERKALAIKRKEYVESGKRIWEKENAWRREWSMLVQMREAERLEREKRLLSEFKELRRTTQIANMNRFRKQLDKQCYDKMAVQMADRQEDINRYNAFEQQCCKEDEQFIAFTSDIIDKKKQAGNPIKPLLKTIESYLEKNNLCMDEHKKVSKKIAKGSVYNSRIIRQPLN